MQLICSWPKSHFYFCEDGYYQREGKILCGAHYRSKYASDYKNPQLYKIHVIYSEEYC